MGDWSSNPGWYIGLTANLGLCAILVLAWMHSVEFAAPVGRYARSLMLGLAMGAGAVLAMLMPVTVMPGVILDLRISLITLAAFFGGPLAAAVATLPALAYRAYVGGPGGIAGLAAIGLTALVGLTGHYLRRGRKISWRDLALLAAAAILAVLATFPLLPGDIWLALLVKIAPPLLILNFISILLLGMVFTQVELRHQLQRRITRTADQLQQITDNLPGFVHSERTEPAGQCTDLFVSPGIRGILGTEPEVVLASEDGLAGLVHPEDREAFARRLREAAASLSPLDCTMRMRHASGDWRWLQLRSRPRALPNGALRWDGVAIDVTERIEAEHKLTWSETRFRAIFDSTFQFTGLLEPAGTILEANRSALEFGGLRRDEVIGWPLWETRWWPTDAAAQKRLRAAIARARAGDLMRYDVEVLGRDGARASVDFSLKPIHDHRGRVILIVAEGRDITERKRLEGEIAYLALHDPLTGLANRTLFRREVERMLARVQEGRVRAALMLIDIDGFKGINDTYGHAVGDWVLCELASRLPLEGRDEDVVARLGGDEFAVIAELGPGNRDPGNRDPGDLPERIVATLARPLTVGEVTLDPAASLGLVVAPEDGGDLDGLLSNADRALYAAKRGRLRHQRYRADMREAEPRHPLGLPAGSRGYPAGLDEGVLDQLLERFSREPSAGAGSDPAPEVQHGAGARGRRQGRA